MIKGLGFGCVRLTSNYTKKQAIQNLETAYENGITHFDAARLYGFGLAEGILGDFLKNKRADITITTKFGISPNNAILKNLFLQNIIRSAYRLSKQLPFRKTTHGMASATMTPKDFTIKNAEHSIGISLQQLKTDYIDYLLLHEALVGEANNHELIQFLEDKKAKGVIKEYGIASFSDTITGNFDLLSHSYTVLQTSNSFPYNVPEKLLIGDHIKKRFYFSPFLYLNKVKNILDRDSEYTRTLSDLADFDVKAFLPDLFLMHQYIQDPSGTTLFTTSKNEKIKGTIRAWENVISMSPENYQRFSGIQKLIAERLIQTISK